MTLTFNPESYAALLAQYQPKVITTEAENETAIAIVEDLEHRSHLTPEEKALLELLVTLISKFEEENYPIPPGTQHSMLLHLMEAKNVTQEDLVAILQSESIVLDVLNGNRQLTEKQIQELAVFFQIDPSYLVE
ncbi:transcriptional regulator [Anabaena sp. UHCC 0451]|uniref:helix-turn-helix domain-containing protein n=1 Tax=Anabaena sp. UHCC 0451 TaxID=2055235 RepID=UPI002B1EF273|nr:transcriptional regulator [Anabaena sp. UHCC 0451]MEA5575636.1 transcriptional regulator [Anabaena sp. UHCC 0451]